MFGLTLMLSYQNCSGPASASDSSTSENSAIQDPLQPDASTSSVAAAKVQATLIAGRLYTLESYQNLSGMLKLTAGDFTLQFSADASAFVEQSEGNAPVLKAVSWVAKNACSSVIDGHGTMARFNGLPVPVGSIELLIDATTAASSPCPLTLGSDDTSLQNANDLATLLSSARTMILNNGKMYLQTADGQIGTFRPLNPPSNLSSDFIAALQSTGAGQWVIPSLQGNPCSDRGGDIICTMVYEDIILNPVPSITVSSLGAVSITTPCGELQGQLEERSADTVPGLAVELVNAQVTMSASSSCTPEQLDQASNVFLVAENVASIVLTSNGLAWTSHGHNVLNMTKSP